MLLGHKSNRPHPAMLGPHEGLTPARQPASSDGHRTSASQNIVGEPAPIISAALDITSYARMPIAYALSAANAAPPTALVKKFERLSEPLTSLTVMRFSSM